MTEHDEEIPTPVLAQAALNFLDDVLASDPDWQQARREQTPTKGRHHAPEGTPYHVQRLMDDLDHHGKVALTVYGMNERARWVPLIKRAALLLGFVVDVRVDRESWSPQPFASAPPDTFKITATVRDYVVEAS